MYVWRTGHMDLRALIRIEQVVSTRAVWILPETNLTYHPRSDMIQASYCMQKKVMFLLLVEWFYCVFAIAVCMNVVI